MTNQITEAQVPQAWDAFLKSKNSGAPDPLLTKSLVEYYYPLIKKVAIRVHLKLVEVQVDELTSMGVEGLYDAVENFDPSRNIKFETYAMYRIRGSMLDAVRKADWVPRLVRSNAHKLEKVQQALESEEGRKLSSSELAEKLKMSEKEFEEFRQSATTPAVHSVNDASWNSDDSERTFAVDSVEDDNASQPINGLLRKEFFAKFLGRNCSEQERKIIHLYYYQACSMKEISEIVGLSESRVSQMHSIIIKRLRKKADRNPAYFSDIFTMVDRICQTTDE
jgi:RNA polymerase sigma factor for flagellar operon FliA